jgi:hypothetical protein
MTLGVADNADGADANVGLVNCMTAENTVSSVRASAGRRHVPRLPFVIPRPQEARADGRECRADASLHRGVGR